MMKKTVLVVSSLALLQGCAGLVSAPRNDVPVEEPGVTGIYSGETESPSGRAAPENELMQIDGLEPSFNNKTERREIVTGQPAVLALLDQAAREQDAGNTANAAATIERALRLDPKNPVLWSRLAGIRLEQGNWQQAYVLANKSNSLGRGDTGLLVRNWRIIELAKTRQGDTDAAEAARERIRALGG